MGKSSGSVVSTLKELIFLQSDSHHDRTEVASYAADWLEELGMKVSVHGEESMPAICATYGKGGVILSGHLDTVPIGSKWTVEQGEVVAGRIYGRGAADMKGGCAAMLQAAIHLTKEDISFSVLLTTDEEDRMTGAYALAELGLVKEAKGVIIGEPTDLQPAYKEKGISRFRLTTHGTAAHASQPWLGANAIQNMNRVIGRLSKLAETPSAPTEDMTVCISMIKGGMKSNVVPDRCEVEIDVRFPTPLTYRKARTIIMDELKGESYDIQMLYELEAYEADASGEFAQAARDFTGNELIVVPYATEAPVFAAVNPNVIVCGPGAMTMAHADDEYVERWQLEKAVELYIHMAEKLT
jgi:acetylornithine deacetylase/succinyl-diaminopimelate desuccinylase-like protein